MISWNVYSLIHIYICVFSANLYAFIKQDFVESDQTKIKDKHLPFVIIKIWIYTLSIIKFTLL